MQTWNDVDSLEITHIFVKSLETRVQPRQESQESWEAWKRGSNLGSKVTDLSVYFTVTVTLATGQE